MNPLVSVIVPAYNAERFLAQAIDSVLGQTFDNYEIVVVDDGSTDRTAEVAAKYDRTRVIRQDNAGASAARNSGAKAAAGKYLAFLDADDTWHQQKLEFQVQAAERQEVDQLITSGGLRTDMYPGTTEEWMVERTELEVYGRSVAEVFAYPYYPTASYFISAELYQRLGGFDESLPTAEDVDLMYRAARERGGCTHVANRLVMIVDRSDSLGEGLRSYQDNLLVVDRFMAGVTDDQRAQYQQISDRLHAKILSAYSTCLYGNGHWFESIGSAFRALRYEPRRARLISFAKRLVPPALVRLVRGQRSQ